MKNNKKKTNHSSSFGRLWSYLQAYRFPLYLAIFLKIVSVIMSVIAVSYTHLRAHET